MKTLITTTAVLAIGFACLGQAKQRKLNTALNHPSLNYWAPFISLDGSTVLFTGDDTEGKVPGLFIALRQGGVDWKQPVMVPRSVNTPFGYSKASTLSPDGKTTFFTTSRGGGQGGFDIWKSQVAGTSFAEAVPIGAPINSSLNDGSPTLSPDGSILYFMRCGKMTSTSADDCKLLIAKKKTNGTWDIPTELPAVINAGNSQMPRILADGQTLIFSSNRHSPNKGGMDFYMSQFENGQWSTPVNLEFANTPGDDIYGSVTSQGLYLLKENATDKKSELVEYLFPPELKPKSTVRVNGQVEGLAAPAMATVSVINLENKKVLCSLRPDEKGSFIAFIPEGGSYSLYVDPPAENFTFFSKRYDMSGKKIPVSDKIVASLKALGPGDEMEMTGVSFNPNTSTLSSSSTLELQKISRLIRGNPSLNFIVDVTLRGLIKDSVQREDLTEALADTVVYEREFRVDSVTTETRDSIAVEYTYHNDRTKKQAESIVAFMVSQGVKRDKVSVAYQALAEPVADNRKIIVKLKAR